MRVLFASVLIAVFFCACHRQPKMKAHQPATPEALQDNTPAFSIASKRGPTDLVANLYDELKNDSPALQDLDKRRAALMRQKEDSSGQFEDFDHKNNSYYTATDAYIASIRDSVLKQNIRALISKSLEKYNNLVQPHTQLAGILNSKDISLADLYTVLKLTKTLSVMEKYQQAHLPPVAPLQAVNGEYDNVIRQTNNLIRK